MEFSTFFFVLGKPSMLRVVPFYSIQPGTNVHHNNNRCTEGNKIEKKDRRSGSGGNLLCPQCIRLKREGR